MISNIFPISQGGVTIVSPLTARVGATQRHGEAQSGEEAVVRRGETQVLDPRTIGGTNHI